MTCRASWLGACVIFGCAAPDAAPVPPASVAQVVAAAPAQPAQSWRPLTHGTPFTASQPLLLTDGTVIVQEFDTEAWWRLTPSSSGSYGDGTWSMIAAMPAGYSPLYFASAVLPDGKVIVEGGEYLAGNPTWTTLGALYDPIADAWDAVAPPAGWAQIGDASGMVLADGRFLLSACCTAQMALFDEATRVWVATGDGKADINDEESWAMLPSGEILVVDTNNFGALRNTEVFDPKTGEWTSAGDTPVQISDTTSDPMSSHEIGPNVLRPDGTVLALGGNGHNAVFDTATRTWSAAPDLPLAAGQQLDVADGPAAVLPNGNVLIAASPGVFNAPTKFLEWDGARFTPVAETPNAPALPSYSFSMLVLPTGEIMVTDTSQDVELYTPGPGVIDTAVPVILEAPTLITPSSPRVEPPLAARRDDSALLARAERPVMTLVAGRPYRLAGQRLSGVSQGAYYGDDEQTYTNYPLVRLTDLATGTVTYCRTSEHSARALGPDTRATTRFDVPATAPRGEATLEVVVNGIASPAVRVDVE
jgi:hypothetical protein